MNGILMKSISHYVKENPKDWESFLPLALLSYRTSVHSSTGMSPFHCLYGIDARLPVDIIFGQVPKTGIEIMNRIRSDLENIQPRIRIRMQDAQARAIANYNRNQRDPPLHVNDRVFLHFPVTTPGVSSKLEGKWRSGFVVLERIGETTYRISNGSFTTTVHRNRLRLLPKRPNHLIVNEEEFETFESFRMPKTLTELDHASSPRSVMSKVIHRRRPPLLPIPLDTSNVRRSPRVHFPPDRLLYTVLGGHNTP
jgi:hypothetical protein